MTLLKWMFPRVLALCIFISPIFIIGAAGAWIEWYDSNNPPQHHETCVETARGATVCGELVP